MFSWIVISALFITRKRLWPICIKMLVRAWSWEGASCWYAWKCILALNNVQILALFDISFLVLSLYYVWVKWICYLLLTFFLKLLRSITLSICSCDVCTSIIQSSRFLISVLWILKSVCNTHKICIFTLFEEFSVRYLIWNKQSEITVNRYPILLWASSYNDWYEITYCYQLSKLHHLIHYFLKLKVYPFYL